MIKDKKLRYTIRAVLEGPVDDPSLFAEVEDFIEQAEAREECLCCEITEVEIVGEES